MANPFELPLPEPERETLSAQYRSPHYTEVSNTISFNLNRYAFTAFQGLFQQ